MRHPGRVAALALCLVLGGAAGIATLAAHRTLPGAALALGATVLVMRALSWWLPWAATAFGAGWLACLLVALGGRPEGDYVISADAWGWVLLGSGFVVLVTALAWGRPPPGTP